VAAMAPDFEAAGAAGPPIRVMIVDDHPMVRVGLRALLDVPDIEVVAEAASGAAAVVQALELRPDVILMDIRMQDGDGLTATRAVRASIPQSRVLVVTSFDDEDYLRSAVQAGAAGFLLKRASRGLLLDSIRTVHAGGSTFPLEMVEGVFASEDREPAAVVAADGSATDRIAIGSLIIDPARHLVLVDEERLVLTYLEFRALVALASNEGEIVAYARLQSALWPEEPWDGDPHRVVSLVARLRSRLGPARRYLQTVKRVGYRLSEPGAGG